MAVAYAFGPFVLDLEQRVLYRSGLPIDLPLRIFEILECLVLHAGRVVSKDMLVEKVWHDAPVGDNNIAQHIHLTRTLLGDASRPHKYIATVHGRGYRLLLEPQKVYSAQTASAADEAGVSRIYAVELVSNAAFFAQMGTASALDSAARLCRKALELHAPLADAHAQLALTMILRAAFLYGAASHELRAARGHAAEALKLDASCARAHVAMAILAIIADLTPDAAFPHLEAASAIHPDMLEVAIVRVIALTAAHHYSDARNAAIEALAMHPASSAIAAYAAFSAYHAGDLAYARATLQRLLVFKPSAAFAIFLLGRTHLAEGNYSAARETLMSIIAGRVSTMAGCEKFRQGAIALLSYIEARTGQLEEARALVRDVQRSRHCSYVSLAVGAAGAREETSVCALLNEARTRCDPWFPFVESDPIFREYRDMPEFHRALFGESPSFKIS